MDQNVNPARISCVVPTCDRGMLLVEAVESVLAQSMRPIEIIVVDNGTSAAVLPSNLQSAITLVTTPPRSGVARARNAGASAATGDYLAFLDDDDLWGQEYLAIMSAGVTEGARCLVGRLDALEHGSIATHKDATGRITLRDLLVYNPGITGSNVVIEKKLFLEIGGYDVSLPSSEDKSLLMEVLIAGVPIAVVPQAQAIQRLHGGDRLSRPKMLAVGIRNFIEKYRSLMRQDEYLFNLKKMYRYQYESGQWRALFLLTLTALRLLATKSLRGVENKKPAYGPN